jgi:gluconokinase
MDPANSQCGAGISPQAWEGIQARSPFAIVVMGVSGSGKSTIGALMAARLKCPFLEGDHFHSPANILKMTLGVPLDDEDRRPWLDSLADALKGAVQQNRIAVATCSALKRSYRDRLRVSMGLDTCFILLSVAPATLAKRLSARTEHFMPASLLDGQLRDLEFPDHDEWTISLDAEAEPEHVAGLAVDRIGAT